MFVIVTLLRSVAAEWCALVRRYNIRRVATEATMLSPSGGTLCSTTYKVKTVQAG